MDLKLFSKLKYSFGLVLFAISQLILVTPIAMAGQRVALKLDPKQVKIVALGSGQARSGKLDLVALLKTQGLTEANLEIAKIEMQAAAKSWGSLVTLVVNDQEQDSIYVAANASVFASEAQAQDAKNYTRYELSNYQRGAVRSAYLYIDNVQKELPIKFLSIEVETGTLPATVVTKTYVDRKIIRPETYVRDARVANVALPTANSIETGRTVVVAPPVTQPVVAPEVPATVVAAAPQARTSTEAKPSATVMAKAPTVTAATTVPTVVKPVVVKPVEAKPIEAKPMLNPNCVNNSRNQEFCLGQKVNFTQDDGDQVYTGRIVKVVNKESARQVYVKDDDFGDIIVKNADDVSR